jgi:hypothetical protein
MFEQFGQMLYKGFAYRFEEIQKDRVYMEGTQNALRHEKWSRVRFGCLDLGRSLDGLALAQSVF